MWCNRALHCKLFFPPISKFFGTERSYVVGGRPADDEGLGRVKVTDFTHTADSDRKSTRLNSSHLVISYAVFCLKKKKKQTKQYNGGPKE